MGREAVVEGAHVKRRGRPRTELKFEVVQGPEMSQEEYEQLVHLLARMFLQDYERRRAVEETAMTTSGCDQHEFDWAYE